MDVSNLNFWKCQSYISIYIYNIIEFQHTSRKVKRKMMKRRDARSIPLAALWKIILYILYLYVHTYIYACRRPFRGIFAASLVPFDERILRWMSVEDIRRGKIIKIAALGFRGELVWNLVRTADILHVLDARTRKRQTNELPECASYRYRTPVIMRCRVKNIWIFSGYSGIPGKKLLSTA